MKSVLARLDWNRIILTISLFLIGALHTFIFGIFQIPENFLQGSASPSLQLVSKTVLIIFAVITSVNHQLLCRIFGLRRTLYLGLLGNTLGMSILFINQSLALKGSFAFVILNTIFFGIALTSVINCLITYIIIEFPKKVGLGIVTFFMFCNFGAMLAPLSHELFNHLHLNSFLFPLLIVLLILSIWYVHLKFFEPEVPPHLVHLRKGTMIWKELHYRLALFVIAITAYGLTESTFNLWGFIEIRDTLGTHFASEAIGFFWAFMIIGQIAILLPMNYISPIKIFYILLCLIIFASIYFANQKTLPHYIIGLAAGGFGCSGIFPILLTILEQEIRPFAKGSYLLFYIEMVISMMIAGYFFGVGFMDLWIAIFGDTPLFSVPGHFYLAVGFISLTGLIAIFLKLTSLTKRT